MLNKDGVAYVPIGVSGFTDTTTNANANDNDNNNDDNDVDDEN